MLSLKLPDIRMRLISFGLFAQRILMRRNSRRVTRPAKSRRVIAAATKRDRVGTPKGEVSVNATASRGACIGRARGRDLSRLD